MSADQFWLSDEQFAKIEQHLPGDTRGRERVDDRRVISGIIHVLKSGGRWIDAPPDYGPRKTLYNRFVRWSRLSVFARIFAALAAERGVLDRLMIDRRSSAPRARPFRPRAAETGWALPP